MSNKYRAQKATRQEKKFDSKLEAAYYDYLVFEQVRGTLDFWLRQVPFDLPGGLKYRVDFVEFWNEDSSDDRAGSVIFTDCKGMPTPVSTNKIKQVEDIYGVKINIVTKKPKLA